MTKIIINNIKYNGMTCLIGLSITVKQIFNIQSKGPVKKDILPNLKRIILSPLNIYKSFLRSCTRIYVYVGLCPVLSSIIPVIIIILTYKSTMAYCDDRTLYDQMNEPVPAHYNIEIHYANGDIITYHPDKTVTFSFEPVEIHVKELHKAEFSSYQNQNDNTGTAQDVTTSKGNDTNEESTPIQQISEKEILANLHQLMDDCKTKREIMLTCLDYVSKSVPFKAWATTAEALKDSTSPINVYIDSFTSNVIPTLSSPEESMVLLHFRTAICIYNAAALENLFEQPAILEEAFYISLGKMIIDSQ